MSLFLRVLKEFDLFPRLLSEDLEISPTDDEAYHVHVNKKGTGGWLNMNKMGRRFASIVGII